MQLRMSNNQNITDHYEHIDNGGVYFKLVEYEDSHTLSMSASFFGCPSIAASFNSLTEDNLITLAKLIHDHLNKTEKETN